MTDFKKWEFEADIPMQDENGDWYDAETGIPYPGGVVNRESWSVRQQIKNVKKLEKQEKIQEAEKKARIAKKRGSKKIIEPEEYMRQYLDWCKENGIDMSSAASRGRAHSVFQKEKNVTN